MSEQLTKRDLKLLQRGDRNTIERWFNKYSDALYTFIFYRVAKNHELAVDIVRATFVTAMRKIEQYEHENSSMFAWLTQLSRSMIENSIQAQGLKSSFKKVKVDGSLLNIYRKIATDSLPDELIERRETTELVQMTLASIPTDYKNVLKEYYYGLRPLKEIADSAGIDESGVRAMLYRARKAFKVAFLKLCSGSDDTAIAGGQNNG